MFCAPDIDFEKELFEAAVNLRGTVAPADYVPTSLAHYVLPLLFLRYLSLRYEQRRRELQRLIYEPGTEYYIADQQLAEEIAGDIVEDPDEYRKVNIFLLPEEATWDYIRRNARADDIKIKLDEAMERLEELYPQLRGVLPKIYAGSDPSGLSASQDEPGQRQHRRPDQPVFQRHLRPGTTAYDLTGQNVCASIPTPGFT